ncbi:MAG: translation initiation factor IF-2 [Ruminococcaceae bacterium]|nr:translation initiation factor IF-2 [Oscillospiraceae bacterium]
MAIDFKYRVHEVSKDLGLQNKDISEVLKKYATEPKNHMTALTDEELDIVFDYFTQKNALSSLAEFFAAAAAAEQEKKKKEEEAEAAEKKAKAKEKASKAKGSEKEQEDEKEVHYEKTLIPEKKEDRVRYVDTRTSNVDLSKFDDRIEDLIPEKAVSDNSVKMQKLKKNTSRNKISQKQREEEAEKMKKLAAEKAKKPQLKLVLPEEIAVCDLASKLKVTNAEVVKKLMLLGVMASASQVIDYDTAFLVAEDFGAKVEKEVIITIEDRLIDDSEDDAESLKPRAPIVVVMGHVDHGKTSLLDAIRHANVTASEAGGITQHIGAYRVNVGDREITFLDTPGHAAFTAMRARGAQVTDIAILVVAADDGIMPQTIEAINHAKAAGVSIIVAINKIDKDTANPDRVKQELTEHGLVAEEWGGDTICVPVSALKREGIDNLLEMVTLVADMKELKANPDRLAKGTVIEAKLDKGRGPVATILVQNGTLKTGDIIIAGTAVGRVRVMIDDKGERVKSAYPSMPVEIVGLAEVPDAGDVFHSVENEKMAREVVEQRKHKLKEEQFNAANKVSLDDLFAQIQAGEVKHLNIIVKADVQGSVEAIKQSLEKLSNDEVKVHVIHGGVGGITESDIMLATASGAIVVGFNVRPDKSAVDSAANNEIEIRLYRIIYDCLEEMQAAMKGMLAPKYKEAVIGHAQVRQTIKISGVGTIAGCYVQDGKILRSSSVRLIRDSIVVYEGSLASLKRFKDDAKEVNEGYECGIGLEKFNDIKENDIIEAYIMEEIKQ